MGDKDEQGKAARRMSIRGLIAASLSTGARLRQQLLFSHLDEIARAAEVIAEAVQAGKTIFLFGNGGSAADAQHIAAEFVGRFVAERRPLPAIALTVDTSALTSIGNDYGFDQIFARQLAALGRECDVAIAITTSGSSKNVLAALPVAREKGMRVVGLTGGSGAIFAKQCDAAVVVPSRNVARIQECHITIGHLMCEVVDHLMVGKAGHANGIPARPRLSTSPKELDLATLVEMRQAWAAAKLRVVWTNGVFDVLHAGHLESLRAAREHGDILIVGVNADAAVTRAKGPGRPVFPAAERAALVAALDVVDFVTVFEEDTPIEVLQKLRPDVHCKGADYAPPNGKPVPEAEVVKAYGGQLVFLPLVPDRSTTSTLDRLARKP